MAAASTPPPPPSADAPAPRAKKTALDYMLGGNSVKTNGYLAAFASNAPLLRALRSDEAYASIIRTHGLKKEITEASAALNRVKRCIERLTSHDTSAGGAKRKDGAGLCFVDLCSGKGFLSMLLANLVFGVFGLLGAKLFARVTLIPIRFLWPSVFVLACIGAYALEQSVLDVWIMVGAGLLGFVLKRYCFAAAPIIMGLILGELVENSLKQSLIIFDHEWLRFLERPIVVTFLALTLFSALWPLVSAWRARRAASG